MSCIAGNKKASMSSDDNRPELRLSRDSIHEFSLTDQLIQPAVSGDIQPLLRMLSSNLPDVALNTVWEIPWTWEHYLVTKDAADKIIGAGALMPLNNNLAEIRGVVVAQSERHSGIATRIVEHLLSWADSSDLDAVCVTRKPEFFRKFGFRETNPAWLDLQRKPKSALRIPSNSTHRQLAPRVAMALAG